MSHNYGLDSLVLEAVTQEAVKAFDDGLTEEDNPYPEEDNRHWAWHDAYIDAKQRVDEPLETIMPPVDPEGLAKELLDRYVESEINLYNHLRFRDRKSSSCSTCQQRRDRLRDDVIQAMTTRRP